MSDTPDNIPQIDLLIHPLLISIEIQSHLKLHLLALVGFGVCGVAQRGQEAQFVGEFDGQAGGCEFHGIGFIHLGGSFAPLVDQGSENGDLEFEVLLEFGLDRQWLEHKFDGFAGTLHNSANII